MTTRVGNIRDEHYNVYHNYIIAEHLSRLSE